MRKALQGLTLAEAILSLAVLALVLVMALGVLQYSMFAGQRGEHTARAMLLAQERLSRLMRTPFEELPGPEASPFPAPFSDYSARLRVSPVVGWEKELIDLTLEVEGPSKASAELRTRRRRNPRELILSVYHEGKWRLARVAEEGGKREILPGSGGNDTRPTVSKEKIVFVSDRGGLGLWSMDLDGKNAPRPLAGAAADALEPALSPDGRRLAFTARERGFFQVFFC